MQARSARGTDDADNDWLTQSVSGPMSHKAPPQLTHQGSGDGDVVEHDPESTSKTSVLTIISDEVVTAKI